LLALCLQGHYPKPRDGKSCDFRFGFLLAAADEVGDVLFANAFQAIRSANNRHISEERLSAAFTDCWRFPFDFISAKYGFGGYARPDSQPSARRKSRSKCMATAISQFLAKSKRSSSGHIRVPPLAGEQSTALGIAHSQGCTSMQLTMPSRRANSTRSNRYFETINLFRKRSRWRQSGL
jgi:hypothetical protein